MEFQQITVSTLINADLNTTWNTYTEPEHIVHWNFASEDWCCPKAENDLQVGGVYFGRMEAKDGSFGFDFKAIYEAVIPQEKLSYKMEDGRRAHILFSPKTNGIEVSITFDAETENPIELQQNGWQAILNQFKRYTESL